MPDLLLRAVEAGDEQRLLVIGRLVARTARALQERLSSLADGRATDRVVVDLRFCTCLDEEGAKVITEARSRLAATGAALVVDGVPPLIECVAAPWLRS